MTRGTLIVHDLPQALAALAAAKKLEQAITLRTPFGAASCAGAGYFQKVAEIAQHEYPEVDVHFVLDCGTSPGHALGAIRIGWKRIRLAGKKVALAKVVGIAAQAGASLDDEDAPVLDLLETLEPEKAAIEWLQHCR